MTCPDPQSTTTSVYRYYDEKGLLIYVGITGRGTSRNREHYTDKHWWQWVRRQTVEHYQTRAAAHKREVDLIQQCRPPFNTQHNPSGSVLADIYLAARAEGVYQPNVIRFHDKPAVWVPIGNPERGNAPQLWQWLTPAYRSVDVHGLTYIHQRRAAVMHGLDCIGNVSDVIDKGDEKVIVCRLKNGWQPQGNAMMKLKVVGEILTPAVVKLESARR